ncbi:MAG: DUF4921 family protein [Pirellulaceae bacterium]|nr:DUF4921 family protein [Pirellulaceae bacterium]
MASARDKTTTSEMRHDWLTDRWVILAPQRSERPIDFVRQPTQVVPADQCPFCWGHEQHTPIAVACYLPLDRHVGQPGWSVRVVPNKFPAVRSDGCLQCSSLQASYAPVGIQEQWISGGPELWSGASEQESQVIEAAKRAATNSELYQRRDVSGGHEVIIEGPQHLQSISQLDRATMQLVFQAYRDRLAYWLLKMAMDYAVLFKNVGHEAGASLVHSHSQLIAANLLPTDVARVADRMQTYLEQSGECLICRIINDEMQQHLRIVEQTPLFVAYCPFASRLPALVTIVPRQHQGQFELLQNVQLEELSWLLHRLVRRLEHCYPDVAYNYVIHTAPKRHRGGPAYHWRIELFPRISTQAGFEWGSECFINPLMPEDAARMLRQASL